MAPLYVMDEKRTTLEKLIISTFRGSKFPSDFDMFRASRKRQQTERELIQLHKDFFGKRWTEIPVTSLRKHAWIFFGAFSERAYIFFLPSFLRASLDPMEHDIRFNTVFSLNPSTGEDVSYATAIGYNPYKALGKSQRIVVAEFLRYCRDDIDDGSVRARAEDALNRYSELRTHNRDQ